MNYLTIPGFQDMSAQEVFDMSARHLLKQMQRSESSSTCLYRSGNLACAAGVFLTDAGAEAADSLSGPQGSPWDMVVQNELAPVTNVQLICELQSVHDYNDPIAWKEKLMDVAKDFNLNDAVCH